MTYGDTLPTTVVRSKFTVRIRPLKIVHIACRIRRFKQIVSGYKTVV